jgi:hypothetical protein
MQNSDLGVLSTADLWALQETVAKLLAARIAERWKELDAQLARLPRKHSAIGADLKPRWKGFAKNFRAKMSKRRSKTVKSER